MKFNKPLPKTVLAKMSPAEQKKLIALEEKSSSLGAEMEKAQAVAGAAMRKEDPSAKRSAAVQSLINKGFKAEFFAFKAGDAVRAYKETMRTKYS
jgi:hypothetical protein